MLHDDSDAPEGDSTDDTKRQRVHGRTGLRSAKQIGKLTVPDEGGVCATSSAPCSEGCESSYAPAVLAQYESWMGTAWSAMGRPDPAGPSTSASNQDAGPSEEACDKDEDMEGGEAGARAEGESEDDDAGSSHVAEGESTHDAGASLALPTLLMTSDERRAAEAAAMRDAERDMIESAFAAPGGDEGEEGEHSTPDRHARLEALLACLPPEVIAAQVMGQEAAFFGRQMSPQEPASIARLVRRWKESAGDDFGDGAAVDDGAAGADHGMDTTD